MRRRTDDTECERPQGASLAQSRRSECRLRFSPLSLSLMLYTAIFFIHSARVCSNIVLSHALMISAAFVQSGPLSWRASAGTSQALVTAQDLSARSMQRCRSCQCSFMEQQHAYHISVDSRLAKL